jgi:glucuronosyltransferase
MLTDLKQSAFIEAFKKLPQYRFVWKFDAENLVPNIELPKNLLIKSWVNQNDVLANPKVVAFISHCGLLSTHETKWWGKPIVGIPIFIDQHRVSYTIC